MFAKKNNFYISPECYLEGEKVSPIKHEYKQGQVYAMVGAKKPHVIIANNLIRLLGNFLLDTKCIVLNSDIKVRIEEANCYYYPDVAVTCDRRDTDSTDEFILYPSLIVEVLSNSTQAFDRGEKFADYQKIPTLKEYVLITQNQIQVECFRLNEAGEWIEYIYKDNEELYLASINFRCTMDDLYKKVPGLKNAAKND